MPRHAAKETVRLVDRNIRNQHGGPLREWRCDKCGKKLMYPDSSKVPAPQCPYCYDSKGEVHKMRKYYHVAGFGSVPILGGK